MYQDKTLVCRDCGKDFVFSSIEQELYAEKGYEIEPVRCPDCRKRNKANFRGKAEKGEKYMYEITCSACGKPAQVPFKPSNDKPVFCQGCYKARNKGK